MALQAIQGHVFWGQWKSDKVLNNTAVYNNVGLMFLNMSRPKVRKKHVFDYPTFYFAHKMLCQIFVCKKPTMHACHLH